MGDVVRLRVVSGQKESLPAVSSALKDVATGDMEVFTTDVKQAFVVLRTQPYSTALRQELCNQVADATGLCVLVIPHGMEFEVMTIDNKTPDQSDLSALKDMVAGCEACWDSADPPCAEHRKELADVQRTLDLQNDPR